MPFKEEELKLQFLEKARFYEELRTYVLNKIQNEIKSNLTSPIKYFKTRIKTFERFKKKVENKGYATIPDTFSNINDLLGVRLICLYKTELQEICDWVEDNFEKIEREIFQWQGLGELQPSNNELQKTLETGYTSIHYVVRILESQPRSIDGPAVDLKDFKFEIQVRTILEEAWGEYTHQVYEDKGAPNYLVKSYQLLSEYLNVINKQVEFLKTTYQTLSKEQVNRSVVENTNFEDKVLNFLDLSNFHLRNLNFIDCNCFTFSFKASTVYNVSFDRCSLMNFDFTGSVLKRVKFLHSKGTRSLMNLKFKCVLEDSEFNQLQMMNTDFGNVKCHDTTFTEVSLMNTDFYNAVFERCTFRNVDFFCVFNTENLKFIDCGFDNIKASGVSSEELMAVISKSQLRLSL